MGNECSCFSLENYPLSSRLLTLSYLRRRRFPLPRNQEHVLLDALFQLIPRPPREERLRPHVEVLHLLVSLHEGHAQSLWQQQGYSS